MVIYSNLAFLLNNKKYFFAALLQIKKVYHFEIYFDSKLSAPSYVGHLYARDIIGFSNTPPIPTGLYCGGQIKKRSVFLLYREG